VRVTESTFSPRTAAVHFPIYCRVAEAEAAATTLHPVDWWCKRCFEAATRRRSDAWHSRAGRIHRKIEEERKQRARGRDSSRRAARCCVPCSLVSENGEGGTPKNAHYNTADTTHPISNRTVGAATTPALITWLSAVSWGASGSASNALARL